MTTEYRSYTDGSSGALGYAYTGLNTLNQIASPITIPVGGRISELAILGRGGGSSGGTAYLYYAMWSSGLDYMYGSSTITWNGTLEWKYGTSLGGANPGSSYSFGWPVYKNTQYYFGFWCNPSYARYWRTQNGYGSYAQQTKTGGISSFSSGYSWASDAMLIRVWIQQGLIMVNNNGTWKKGIAWVNDGGTWKQSKAVWVKNGSTWVVSQ